MNLWLLIAAVAAATLVIKAVGPVALGGRALPPRMVGVIALLPAALLAALVATATFALGTSYRLDALAGGLAVAALLLWRRAHVAVVVLGAAAATALLRALGVP